MLLLSSVGIARGRTVRFDFAVLENDPGDGEGGLLVLVLFGIMVTRSRSRVAERGMRDMIMMMRQTGSAY